MTNAASLVCGSKRWRISARKLVVRTGDFHLSEFSARLKTPDGAQCKLELANARADFEAKSGPAAQTLDGDNTTGWSIGPQVDRSHVIVFEFRTPQDFPAGSHLYVELEDPSPV